MFFAFTILTVFFSFNVSLLILGAELILCYCVSYHVFLLPLSPVSYKTVKKVLKIALDKHL